MTFSIVALDTVVCFAQCHLRSVLKINPLCCVDMLNVTMLHVAVLNAVMLYVAMLNIAMLSIILAVIMLCSWFDYSYAE